MSFSIWRIISASKSLIIHPTVGVFIFINLLKGIHLNNGAVSANLFSPPLYLFGIPSMEGEISSSTNKSLKVFVSTDDSSIKIKKGEQQKVIYHLEWSDEG